MEIPLNALIECTDGICGRSAYVLINPILDKVTHLVVKEDFSPYIEYMVPVGSVVEVIADTIHLSCSKAELERMEPFIKKTFIEEMVPDKGSEISAGMGANYYFPYVTPEKRVYEAVKYQEIPLGEMTVKRGTRVMATDGYVGKVDEFMIDPENGHITHMVMREGHLWGQKDVAIPLSAKGGARDGTLYLNIDKHQIESLPTILVQRRWS